MKSRYRGLLFVLLFTVPVFAALNRRTLLQEFESAGHTYPQAMALVLDVTVNWPKEHHVLCAKCGEAAR